MSQRRLDLGIDLGTANTLAVVPGSGVVLDQPSICCFQAYDAVPRFVAAGALAHSYVGKVAKPLKIIHPLRSGVLSDMAAARELLAFVRRAVRPRSMLGRLRPAIGVPADATQAERRALSTAAVDAGFADPELVPEPLLAALGLGFEIDDARARMVIDCGAGTTEIAVISLGGICVSQSVRGGGDALDQSLTDYLHLRHRFHIGTASAEALKLRLSDVLAGGDPAPVEVRGMDAASGLPRELAMSPAELLGVWNKHAEQIVAAVREALSETPPELSEDIFEDGITLTGGGAMTALLADRISANSGIAATVAEAPLGTVAAGLQRGIEEGRLSGNLRSVA